MSCYFIKKETPTQMFFCEFCNIFKSNCFHRTLPVTACENSVFIDVVARYRLNSDSHIPKSLFLFSLMKGPIKMTKNAFHFVLKALFVLEIFRFLAMSRNGLIRKLWLISKFMTSQTGEKKLQYTYCPISQEVKATKT